MMEGAPNEVDVELLRHDFKMVNGVTEVHDLHVWSLSMGKWALTSHVTCSTDSNSVLRILNKIA